MRWAPAECAVRAQVEGELTQICNSILSLLDQNLIPSATTGESKVRPGACRGARAAFRPGLRLT